MTVEESESYERLFKLSQNLGLKLNDNNPLKGEILSYCAGVELVRSFFDEIFSEINLESATKKGLNVYTDICNIDDTLSIEEKREEIIKRLSEQFGEYPEESLQSALEGIDSNISFSSQNRVMTITGVQADMLQKLGKVLEELVAPYITVLLESDGCTFDYWDSLDFTFDDYDNLNCPFSILDTMKQTS